MAKNVIEAVEQYLIFASRVLAETEVKLKQEELSSLRADSLLLQRHQFMTLVLRLHCMLVELRDAERCDLAVLKANAYESLIRYWNAEIEANWGDGSFTARLERAASEKSRWESDLATVWRHQSVCRVCIATRSAR